MNLVLEPIFKIFDGLDSLGDNMNEFAKDRQLKKDLEKLCSANYRNYEVDTKGYSSARYITIYQLENLYDK